MVIMYDTVKIPYEQAEKHNQKIASENPNSFFEG
jgi:hypothetical protein